MSVKSIIARYQQEKDEIQSKVAALKKREETVDLMLSELRGAARVDSGRVVKEGKEQKKAKKVKKAKPEAVKRPVKKRKGTTVRDSIIQAVAEAKAPLTAGAIIERAGELSGGAVPSIRTQINALTKAGDLEQVPYTGRGFQYQIPANKGEK